MRQAGVDIEPGVYLSRSKRPVCLAVVARTADYDILADDSDPDGFLRTAAPVGDALRVVVNRGEFVRSYCGRWTREDPESPDRTADPATNEGACTILLGKDDLAARAVRAVAGSRTRPGADIADLQDRLMAIVLPRNEPISDLAGTMVDYLDDPKGWSSAEGKADPKVLATVAKVRSVCAGSTS